MNFSWQQIEIVRTVRGDDNNGSNYIRFIRFLNSNGNQVSSYRPKRATLEYHAKSYELEPGEQIIGLYGVMGKCDWITSLGFLVRSYQPE